jgi:predicted nucleic acid-binding protein
MTNNNIILDTNCLYNFLNGEELEVDLVGDKKIVISEITEMEVQCNPKLNSTERKLLKEFLAGITIIRLNEKLRDFAIKIRLTTRMKLMDSIIAATAQFTNIAVVTCDSNFDSVKTANVILLPAVEKR